MTTQSTAQAPPYPLATRPTLSAMTDAELIAHFNWLIAKRQSIELAELDRAQRVFLLTLCTEKHHEVQAEAARRLA